MDPTTPLHQDPLHGDATETPHQEAQRTCTRTSPCQHQGCLVCCTPTNHVRNLDEALTDSEATQVSPTTPSGRVSNPQSAPNLSAPHSTAVGSVDTTPISPAA